MQNNSNLGEGTSDQGTGMEPVAPSPLQQNAEDIPWQRTSVDIKERDVYLLESGHRADINFIVGSQKELMPCHRLYLSKTSAKLDSLLFEEVDTSSLVEIHVPDVTPKAFKALLRYVYVGTLEVDSYVTAWQTLQAAKKFDMPDVFINMLREYLRDHVDILLDQRYCTHGDTTLNIWPSIQFALDCEEQDLLEVAWEYVIAKTTEMLQKDNFEDISLATLEKLVMQEYLNCSEIDLFNACINWAIKEANRRQLQATPQNLRAILVNVLPQIRFLTMSSDTFSSGPANVGILTAHEILAIVSRNVDTVNLCNNESVRNVRLESDNFYVCNERRIKLTKGDRDIDDVEEYNKYSRYNSITMTTFDVGYRPENEHSVVAFSIPTQIKNNIDYELYEEDVTVYVIRHHEASYYDFEPGDMIVSRVVNIKRNVPYNSILTYEFERAVCIYKDDIHYTYHIVFHKSGLYPKICPNNELNEDGTFDSYGKVEITDDDFFVLYYKFLPDLPIPRPKYKRRRNWNRRWY